MLDGLIIIVPLLAGLALIGVIVLGMFKNPSVSNSNATMGWAASPSSVRRPLVQTGSGSRSYSAQRKVFFT